MKHVFLMVGLLCLAEALKAATYNVVTDFGANGNAVQFYVGTSSNSPLVVANSIITSPNTGDILEVWGCGQQTYGWDSYNPKSLSSVPLTNTPTADYYFKGTITNIVNGTNIQASSVWYGPFTVTSISVLSTNYIGNGIDINKTGTSATLYSNPPAIHYADLICNITNVVNATNLYVDQWPQQTFSNTFATYGHDNRTNFQNAFNACATSNDTINVPSGVYFFLGTNRPTDAPPANDGTSFYSVQIIHGGFHLIGQGTNNTILLGQGAWLPRTYTDGTYWYTNKCKRAAIFAFKMRGMSNDYPASIESLTLDGGVTNGNTTIHGTYPNDYDGEGWDGSHGAIITRSFGSGSAITTMTWSNLLIDHWRGEMVKSLDGTTNGNLTVENCRFEDGNATAINYYASTIWTNCVFKNLYQIGEYYQYYGTNTSEMVGCVFTNIWVNGWAINGGSMKAPPFKIHNNDFYFEGSGQDGILTLPACNLFIYSNNISAVNAASNHFYGIIIGATGYQSSDGSMNSNVWIYGNNFTNVSTVISYGVGNPPVGGTNYSDSNWTYGLHVFWNYLNGNSGLYPTFAAGNGWAVNVDIESNRVSESTSAQIARNAAFSSGGRGEPVSFVATNNDYWKPIYNFSGNSTKTIDYAVGGPKWSIYGKYYTNSTYLLVDTNASQLPAGAALVISNGVIENGAGTTLQIVSGMGASPETNSLPLNQTATYFFSGATWMLAAGVGVTNEIAEPVYNPPPQFIFRSN